jgi:hypothetical protein
MEWLGTGFTLTIGGMRLRVRIALEDAPCVPVRYASAEAPEPWPAQSPQPQPRTRNTSSFN